MTLRPEEKTDAATAVGADSTAESRASSGPTVTGELQLSTKERGSVEVFYLLQ